MGIIVGLLEHIVAPTIAGVAAGVIVFFIGNAMKNRGSAEHGREKTLKNIQEEFTKLSYLRSGVKESQDCEYVINAIERLLEVSARYFSVSNPELRSLVADYWKLYYEAKNYVIKSRRSELPHELPHKRWMKFTVISKFLGRESGAEAPVEVHKTCYWDLYDSFNRVLEIETAVWRKIIAADTVYPNEILKDFHQSTWFTYAHSNGHESKQQ